MSRGSRVVRGAPTVLALLLTAGCGRFGFDFLAHDGDSAGSVDGDVSILGDPGVAGDEPSGGDTFPPGDTAGADADLGGDSASAGDNFGGDALSGDVAPGDDLVPGDDAAGGDTSAPCSSNEGCGTGLVCLTDGTCTPELFAGGTGCDEAADCQTAHCDLSAVGTETGRCCESGDCCDEDEDCSPNDFCQVSAWQCVSGEVGAPCDDDGDCLAINHCDTGTCAIDSFLGAPSVSVSNYVSCAVSSGGVLKCWGEGDFGRLGLGDTRDRGDGTGEMGLSLPAVSLGIGRTALSVTAGFFVSSCALLDNSQVKCWGRSFAGQLGYGDTIQRGDQANEMGDSLPFVSLGSGRSAISLATGDRFSCVVLDTGDVKCWGYNFYASLGLGDTRDRGDQANEMGDSLPVVSLGPGRTAQAVSSPINHVCALLDDDSVKCWGYNGSGQLGYGDSNTRGDSPSEMGSGLPAVNLGTGRSATAVSAGALSTCALLDSAQVKCWGSATAGTLGLGDTRNRGDQPNEMGDSLPTVDLGTNRNATGVSTGFNIACALLDNEQVKCWGYNGSGALGLGDTMNRGAASNEMGDSLPALALGTGRRILSMAIDSHACAVLDDLTVKCWGVNTYGELGYGDAIVRGDDPSEVGAGLPVIDLGW